MTLKEIEEKIREKNKNISVLDERFITTKTKTRREILIENSENFSRFWIQTSKINSYNYDIVRYNTDTVKKLIRKLTNGEYELIGECSKYNSKINVLHKKCGTTSTYRASHFINDGTRCKLCLHNSFRKTNEEFDRILSERNSFFIRESNYVNYHHEILIYCKKCKKRFITKPANLDRQFKSFNKLYCPNCSSGSHGETFINEILIELGVNFKREYSDKRCKDKRPLRFDFAIFDDKLDLKAIIEYDGSQHKNPKSIYAGERFNEILYHDKLKDDFCSKNNIPLLRTSKLSKDTLKIEIENFLKNISSTTIPNGGEIPQQE